MVQKRIIAETDDIVAIEQNCGSSSVIVAFNEMGFVRNGLTFWGDSFFLKQGLTAIGVVTPKPNWYPAEAMNVIVNAILENSNGKRVITYGHSQGGYGALKYSSRLGASVALAFSPQWSIDPADVNTFDPRFTTYFDAKKLTGARIEQDDLGESAYIFFDKAEKSDAANAAQLTKLRRVKSVVIPFAKHDSIRIAAEGRTASRIISLCAQGTTPDALEMRKILRSGRRQSTTYGNHMAHELLLRMSRSKVRSSLFADRWIRATGAGAFYLALVCHAKGDSKGAAGNLSQLGEHDFEGKDLMSCWQMANRLQFDGAEVIVASQIHIQDPNNTWMGLHVVNTLVRTGQRDLAQTHLLRLARNPDAASHLCHFADFAVKLGRADIIELLLSQAQPTSTQNAIRFSLIEFYTKSGDRRSALRQLIELERSNACNAAELKRISDLLVQINEFGFSLEIRSRLLQESRSSIDAALDVVEARLPLDKTQSMAELGAIVSRPDVSCSHLERASYLYERSDELTRAERAIEKAASMPKAGPGVRHRWAYMMVRQRKTRRARAELASLLVECANDPHRLRALGDLAALLPDQLLYHRCAVAQHRCDPTHPDAILYLARSYRLASESDRAQALLRALFEAEHRIATMSDRHWILLAQELYESGDKVYAMDAAHEAAARQPNDVVVLDLLKALTVLQRLGNQEASSPSIAKRAGLSPASAFRRLAAILIR